MARSLALQHYAVILGQLFGHRGDERLADPVRPFAVNEGVLGSTPDCSVALEWENLVLLEHGWRDGCACVFVGDDPYLLSRLEPLLLFGWHWGKSLQTDVFGKKEINFFIEF